jgi:putative flippase GtrA
MINRFFSKQFLVFLATGGIAALINFLSRILYSNWLDFSLAVFLAYITGMITAFILAKKFN